MFKFQYFVKEKVGKGRYVILLATMNKNRAISKYESFKKTYPEAAKNFKIEKKLLFFK